MPASRDRLEEVITLLLVLAALGFAAPAACAAGSPATRRIGKVAAIIGLFLLANALIAVKDSTGEGRSDVNVQFAIARNGASLAYALIPLALAIMRPGRFESAGMIVVGLGGAALLAALIAVEGSLWTESSSGALHFQPSKIPGAAILMGHGDLRVGWWLLFLGAILSSVPLAADAWNAARHRPRRELLTPLLFGTGLMTLAMAILFWHQSDLNHRETAYSHIWLMPIAAIALSWVNGRLTTARFALRLLSAFGAAIAIWMLAGGGFEEDSQSLTSGLTLLHELCLLLLPILLLVDGLLLLASRRGLAPQRKPRSPFK